MVIHFNKEAQVPWPQVARRERWTCQHLHLVWALPREKTPRRPQNSFPVKSGNGSTPNKHFSEDDIVHNAEDRDARQLEMPYSRLLFSQPMMMMMMMMMMMNEFLKPNVNTQTQTAF